MDSKYFNEALIGNQKITASFSGEGELLRFYNDTVNYEIVDSYRTALKVNDSYAIYLDDDVNNEYIQDYIGNTNILNTNIYNRYFRIEVNQLDCIPINKNILIKKYVFKNKNEMDLDVKFLVYSKLLEGSFNADCSGYIKANALIQYNYHYSLCTFSNEDFLSHQINNSLENMNKGELIKNDYIGMSVDSAVSYNIGVLKPGEERTFYLYVYINDNGKINLLNELDLEIERYKHLDPEMEIKETIGYWEEYIKSHDLMKVLDNPKISDKVKQIYVRSILLFNVLTNKEYGGIAASLEIDEKKTKCGRYAYCWPRDAVYITQAFDYVGMREETERFYKIFCKKTQSRNGKWEQRFYVDGRLAPSWGYQIDETASIIYGVCEHYKMTHDLKFISENLSMCENAMSYLISYVDDFLSTQDKHKVSYDLWEENQGYSLYSISCIVAAYNASLRIFEEVKALYSYKKREELDYLQTKYVGIISKQIPRIIEYINEHFYDKERESFIRRLGDNRLDISILGAVVPFKILEPNDEKVVNTVRNIKASLKKPEGGYVRYEYDNYIGGPWPICTLWMALYNLEHGEYDEAIENFDFATNSASDHGLLPEQTDNRTMQPLWNIGLNWSHAMYILAIHKMIEKGLF